MSDAEDDWETADLSTFGKPPPQPLKLGSTKKIDPNLRPSAPTFLPRAPPTSSSQPRLFEPTAPTTTPAQLYSRIAGKKDGSKDDAPFGDDEAWSRPPVAVTSNRQIWQAANTTPTAPLPPVAPTSLLPTPVPPTSLRILRRPSPSSSGASTPAAGAGGEKRKTLEEREEEYRKARERIFAKERAEEEEKKGKKEKEKAGEDRGDGTSVSNGSKKSTSSDNGKKGSSSPTTPNGSTTPSLPSSKPPTPTTPIPQDPIDAIIRLAELSIPTSSSTSSLPASTSSTPRSRGGLTPSSASSSSSNLSNNRTPLRGGRGNRSPAHSPHPQNRQDEDDDFETRTDMYINRITSGAVGPGPGLVPYQVQQGMYGMGLAGIGGAQGYMGMIPPPLVQQPNYGVLQVPSILPVNARAQGQGYTPYGFEPVRPPSLQGGGRGGPPGELRRGGEAAGVVRQPRGPGEAGAAGFGGRGGGAVGR